MSVNMLLISGAVKAGTSKTGKKIITYPVLPVHLDGWR